MLVSHFGGRLNASRRVGLTDSGRFFQAILRFLSFRVEARWDVAMHKSVKALIPSLPWVGKVAASTGLPLNSNKAIPASSMKTFRMAPHSWLSQFLLMLTLRDKIQGILTNDDSGCKLLAERQDLRSPNRRGHYGDPARTFQATPWAAQSPLCCFLMLAVIRQRTVSLFWLARHPCAAAKPESVYQRIQRFSAFCAILARPVGALVRIRTEAHERLGADHGPHQLVVRQIPHLRSGGQGHPQRSRDAHRVEACQSAATPGAAHRIALMEEGHSILPYADIRALTMAACLAAEVGSRGSS